MTRLLRILFFGRDLHDKALAQHATTGQVLDLQYIIYIMICTMCELVSPVYPVGISYLRVPLVAGRVERHLELDSRGGKALS